MPPLSARTTPHKRQPDSVLDPECQIEHIDLRYENSRQKWSIFEDLS